MMDTLNKLLDLLERRGRRRALLLLGMVLIMGLMETLGVASIMPFMAVLVDPSVVETNRYLSTAYQVLGFATTNDFLVFLGAAVFVFVIGSTALKALTTWAMVRFNRMRGYIWSRRLFKGYLQQPYVWFLGRHSSDLGKTVLSEVNEVLSGALMPAMQLVVQGSTVLLLVGLLLVIDPVLALTISAALGGTYGLILWSSSRYLTRIGVDRVRANRERFRITNEALSAIKDVKTLGLEETFLRRFEKPSMRMVRRSAASKMISQLPQFALQVIVMGGILLIVQYQLIVHGNFAKALPLIAVYGLAAYRLMPAFQKVYQSLSILRFSKPALDLLHSDLVEEELDRPADEPVVRTIVKLPSLWHQLELRGVTYRYPSAASPTLTDVTITVPYRTTVGLVGQTGAGKTTLVDVILGLLEPEQGALLVDGTPINSENRRAWQQYVGYVPQHIFLTDDTVAANIAFGIASDKINMAAVERATKIANLQNFVLKDLEHGYQTLIGERGVRLSGGQRQRIGIARALYRDPDIIIMDEATSALDNIAERAVMDAVRNLGHRKTIILIAHRLTTVQRCDLIYLLERGHVIAGGTYDELAERSELFQTMVAAAAN